jgi:pyruvate kinase
MLCTVGPSLETADDLERAVDAGMRIMRINCSHAQPSEVGQKIDRLRSLRGPFEYRGQNVNLRAVMMDTQGPEIRTGRYPADVDEVELVEGRMLTLTAHLSEADTGTLYSHSHHTTLSPAPRNHHTALTPAPHESPHKPHMTTQARRSVCL